MMIGYSSCQPPLLLQCPGKGLSLYRPLHGHSLCVRLNKGLQPCVRMQVLHSDSIPKAVSGTQKA